MFGRFALSVACLLFLAVFLASISNVWAEPVTMPLPDTGFDSNGIALGNYGVDGNWGVSGSQFGGSAAYVIMPGDPDWYFTWGADTASNGWSGSSWINDNDTYDGGGIAPPAYTYSASFNLAGFQLDNNLQLSGMWGIDDTGILALNGNTISAGTDFWDGNPAPVAGDAYSLSYATNPTWFNAGINNITITMTNSDNLVDGVRFEGIVSGNAVPEPSALTLLGAGAVCLLARVWRRQKGKRLPCLRNEDESAILSFPSPWKAEMRRAA